MAVSAKLWRSRSVSVVVLMRYSQVEEENSARPFVGVLDNTGGFIVRKDELLNNPGSIPARSPAFRRLWRRPPEGGTTNLGVALPAMHNSFRSMAKENEANS